jgi:hypothetical protein
VSPVVDGSDEEESDTSSGVLPCDVGKKKEVAARGSPPSPCPSPPGEGIAALRSGTSRGPAARRGEFFTGELQGLFHVRARLLQFIGWNLLEGVRTECGQDAMWRREKTVQSKASSIWVAFLCLSLARPPGFFGFNQVESAQEFDEREAGLMNDLASGFFYGARIFETRVELRLRPFEGTSSQLHVAVNERGEISFSRVARRSANWPRLQSSLSLRKAMPELNA